MFQEERTVNTFFCAFENNTLVGVAKLKTNGSESMRHPGFYNWFSFLSVKDEHKGRGISKILIDEMFRFIKAEELDHLLVSGYTQEGFDYMKKNLVKKAAESGIKFQDDDRPSFP